MILIFPLSFAFKILSIKEILSRITYPEAVERVRRLQVRHLNNLLDAGRMQRLIESEFLFDVPTYTLRAFLSDTERLIWSELDSRSSIDVNRRNLQRAYLERLAYLMTEEQSEVSRAFRSYRTNVDLSQSDIRPLIRARLDNLEERLEKAAKKSDDEMTRIHLEDAHVRVEALLDDE